MQEGSNWVHAMTKQVKPWQVKQAVRDSSLPRRWCSNSKKTESSKTGNGRQAGKSEPWRFEKSRLSAGVATKVLAAAKAATATKETVKKTTGKAASAAKKAASKAKSTSKKACHGDQGSHRKSRRERTEGGRKGGPANQIRRDCTQDLEGFGTKGQKHRRSKVGQRHALVQEALTFSPRNRYL